MIKIQVVSIISLVVIQLILTKLWSNLIASSSKYDSVKRKFEGPFHHSLALFLTSGMAASTFTVLLLASGISVGPAARIPTPPAIFSPVELFVGFGLVAGCLFGGLSNWRLFKAVRDSEVLTDKNLIAYRRNRLIRFAVSVLLTSVLVWTWLTISRTIFSV